MIKLLLVFGLIFLSLELVISVGFAVGAVLYAVYMASQHKKKQQGTLPVHTRPRVRWTNKLPQKMEGA